MDRLEGHIDQARALYEKAVFGGDPNALDVAEQRLDRVEAALALARGRLMHGRFLCAGREDREELVTFQRAAELYDQLGDVRGQAEAWFWIGCFHHVVRADTAAARPALRRAAELASRAGDSLTLSYALRHVAMTDHSAGHLDSARNLLEESTRLRRQISFEPGVAANLVGLAYIAAAQGQRDEGLALLDEAETVAAANNASTVLNQAQQARKEL